MDFSCSLESFVFLSRLCLFLVSGIFLYSSHHIEALQEVLVVFMEVKFFWCSLYGINLLDRAFSCLMKTYTPIDRVKWLHGILLLECLAEHVL